MAFITNFNLKDLPIYQHAVKTWSNSKDFSVSRLDNEKNPRNEMGSLHYFGAAGTDLSSFWRHFETVHKQMTGAK